MTQASDSASHALQYALAAHKAGDFAAAVTEYRAYLQTCPHSAAGHMHLGVALAHLARWDEAVASYREAIRLHPHYAEAYGNLAFCLLQANQTGESERPCLIALQLQPELTSARFALGLLRYRQGRLDEARNAFSHVVSIAPNHAEALTNLASIHFMQGNWQEAEERLRQALQLHPDLFEAWNSLGATLMLQSKLSEAEQCLRRAVALREDPDALSNLGATLTALGRFEEAQSVLREAIDLSPQHWDAHSNLLYALNFCEITPESIRAQAQRYGDGLSAFVGASGGPFTTWNHEQKPRCLRVGLVSGDLREHPVGYFLENVLAACANESIQWFAYPNHGAKDDALSQRLKKYCTAWRPLSGHDVATAAQRIHDDGIHVLIDLSGHTGGNVMPLFAWKPAPVQVSWLGYFATTGVCEIDYLITDPVSSPPGSETAFSERLAYLPDSRLCFTPPTNAPDVAPLPAQSHGFLTFGSMQHPAKIGSLVIQTWGRIFDALPTARLRLQNAAYAEAETCQRLREQLQAAGIAAERVVFYGGMGRMEYLAAHAEIDVILDTFPYPGGTTTCEALWMGVPTLALAGSTLLGRQGASLLSAAGLSNWIAANKQDYVDKAVAFGRDITGLAVLRALLRKQMTDSPLCDSKRFAENLVGLLWTMWRSTESERKQENILALAQQHAEAARFADFVTLCRQITASLPDDLTMQLDVGALLSNYGFLAESRTCYERAQVIAPTDLRATVNLANVLRDSGEHTKSRRLYADLLRQLPDHPLIRRNALTSLEYDPDITDAERLAQAKAWGEWAIARSGGARPRPALQPLQGRQLRIGNVSADLCQHTVGLFVKDVLKAHDPARVQVFAYSAGQVKDWVTDEIRAACIFRDVSTLDDTALVAQIRADGIDVLIDLSGHTGGSRLTAFAHRPAPVMVSWLGYFATTGLPTMDAVLLDDWHAPAGTEEQFVEPILRLPSRFCYTPVPWMPIVSPAPTFSNGLITFGCFNNTAKFNDGVFDVWAKVLHSVPHSRLILKWRTFNDEAFRQKVTQAFVDRGIAAERIELRGPSFHVDVLKEYADIDIALDPFPFTGGQTSCEALWMGVPVVTWPQSRVVSRQTFAFLSAIGLPELAAKDADDYVRIAVELATDPERLADLRTTLRDKMRASPLMDAAGFTRQLEDALIDLYRKIEAEERQKAMNAKTILHVGPGHRQNGAKLPPAFQGSDWKEIRLDIDPANEPDIVGSMLDMAAVADASVDAIYSAHNIEHVCAHEVPVVLKEFLRVLKPEGFLVVTCPDLQAVCQLVAEDKLNDAAYTSQAGPITPLDILYGHGAALAAGHHYMAHKTGFTLKTLTQTLHTAGFATSAGKRRARGLDLWIVASKAPLDEAAIRDLAGTVLPD